MSITSERDTAPLPVNDPEPMESRGKMAVCEVCGNSYDKSFEVVMGGVSHTFDSFECAIQALAPMCEHCGCRIIGHGVEAEGVFFCCVHCAEQIGEMRLRGRV